MPRQQHRQHANTDPTMIQVTMDCEWHSCCVPQRPMVVHPKGQPIMFGFIGLIIPPPMCMNMPPIIIPVIIPIVMPIIGEPIPPWLTTVVLEREPPDLLLLLLPDLLDLELLPLLLGLEREPL